MDLIKYADAFLVGVACGFGVTTAIMIVICGSNLVLWVIHGL